MSFPSRTKDPIPLNSFAKEIKDNLTFTLLP